MGRRPMIAGNWKMYTTSGGGAILVQDLEQVATRHMDDVDVVVCPPFTGLRAVSTVLEFDKPGFRLGAQDCFWEDEGAYTGEISPKMLTHLGVTHVIIGHSERREFFGETDMTVNKKVKAVLAAGMTPITCCGENLGTYEAGQTESFVRGQITRGLAGLSAEDATRLVVAYEPIWSIGTGHTPVPEKANDVCRAIRATIGAMYGPPSAMQLRILYGGSVKPENAKMFLCEPDIDGALVGGASLDAKTFAAIVEAAVGTGAE